MTMKRVFLINMICLIVLSSNAQEEAVQKRQNYGPMQRTSVEFLLGYLKVYPLEMGPFSSEPTLIISKINDRGLYGYNSWRIPTSKELLLLRANNYTAAYGEYMSLENKRGKLILVSDGARCVTEEQEQEMYRLEQERKELLKKDGWVDLGLPSGTLWMKKNEDGGFYDYDQAISEFGDKLPAIELWEELRESCEWIWKGNGRQVVGPSGESIFLPAAGYHRCHEDIRYVGDEGCYWSSTPHHSDGARGFYLQCYGAGISSYNRCHGLSVRLVHD